MNIQAHTTTGSSPYELVFGQKPRAVLFPSGKSSKPLLEEDLEKDGIHIEELQEEEMPDENDGLQQGSGSKEQGHTGWKDERRKLQRRSFTGRSFMGVSARNSQVKRTLECFY